MSYEPYIQRDFDTAAELWNALSPTQTLFAPPSRVVFRGQASTGWPLLPTVLRDKYRTEVVATPYGSSNADAQVFHEIALLESFAGFCDQVGVPIPGDSISFRTDTLSTQRQDRYYKDPSLWPNPDLLGVMALAQHYGVPTRLLDWSLHAYVALYFACAPALADYKQWTPGDRLAIWALNIEPINIYSKHIQLVKAPGAISANLAAQSGLFTVNKQLGVRGQPFTAQPLEKVFGDLPGTPLLRLTVPVTESVTLHAWCASIGITAATMHPGPVGAARAAVEHTLAWAAECSLREQTRYLVPTRVDQ